MKRHIIIFFILFFSNGGFSQPSVRFKKFYDLPPHFTSESYDVTTTDFGYIISGITVDTIGGIGFFKLTLLGVDTLGNQLWVKKYGNPNFQFVQHMSNKWIVKKDSSLYFTGTVNKAPNKVNSVLIKFNFNGDSLWQKEYTDTQNFFVTIGLNTEKNNFILTGYVGDSASQSMLLMKVDSVGNELWRQKINTNTYSIEGRCVVYDAINRKYVIGGTHAPPSSFATRSIVIVTDSVGIKLNQYSFSSSFGGTLNHIAKTYDNNFIVCGSNSTGIPIGAFEKVKRQIVKFNISGSVIWSKEFGDPSLLNEFYVIKELANHDLVLGGQYDTLLNAGLGLNSNFLIQKCDQNGDNIWSRTIDVITGNYQDRLNSMDTTIDGGYVLTGFFIGGPSPNKFCLVKLDSLGCDSIGCQFVGIEEQTKSEIGLEIYPNPANDFVNFMHNGNTPATIEVRNLLGELVDKIQIKNSEIYQYNTQALNKSIYFVSLYVNGKLIENKKFVLVK